MSDLRRHSSVVRSAVLWLSAVAMSSSPAAALDIVFTVDPAYGMSTAALTGFEAAAVLWESRLYDPVTVSITIGAYDFGPDRANIIGGASPTYYDFAYGQYRSAYEADVRSDADAAVLTTLSTETTYQRFVNNVSPGWHAVFGARPAADLTGPVRGRAGRRRGRHRAPRPCRPPA